MISRALLKKFLLGLVGLMILGAFCAWIFKKQLTNLGSWFIDAFGLWGIALGTLITDSSPIPMTSEPLAVLALASEVSVWQLILIMSLASHCACFIGYGGGYILGQQLWFQKIINKRFPELNDTKPDYVVRLVALGALLPIPYAITTWIAGSLQISLLRVFLASSLRWIKTLITIMILAGGWWLGGNIA